MSKFKPDPFIKEGKDFINLIKNQIQNYSVSSFIYQARDYNNNKPTLVESFVCYASMRVPCLERVRILPIQLQFGKGWIKDKKDLDLVKPYLKWITRESAWAPAFKNDKTWKWLDSGIELDTNLPKPFIMGAATALREGWEFKDFKYVWNYLVKNGISKEVAHYLATKLSWDNAKNTPKKYTLTNNNHWALPQYTSLQDFKNYKEKKLLEVCKDKTPCKDSQIRDFNIWGNLFSHKEIILTNKNLENIFNLKPNPGAWGEKSYYWTPESITKIKELFNEG